MDYLLPALLVIALAVGAAKYRALKVRALHHAAEAKRLGEELLRAKRERDEELDHMLNALTDAFFLIEPSGTIVFANSAAKELIQGRSISNRFFEEILLEKRFTKPITQALAKQEPVTETVVLSPQSSPLGPVDRRGVTAWLVDASPTDFGNLGQLLRVIIRDITSEHQSEQVRKDFVANASHELRTPLAIINGYLETLLEEGMLEDHVSSRRFIATMQKHGGRIARIVEDMLVISRLESGEAASLKIAPFPYRACVEDVLERLEPVISGQGARISLKLPKEEVRILGDRFYWTQVLFNLVENALKQNPDSPVKVSIGGTRLPDGSFRMRITDNGVGIPSRDLAFIFKRFYRVEKHHDQSEIKGTGLGLSIVKRAVEAHDGSISVTSVPGSKTSFEITLPAERIVEDITEAPVA